MVCCAALRDTVCNSSRDHLATTIATLVLDKLEAHGPIKMQNIQQQGFPRGHPP